MDLEISEEELKRLINEAIDAEMDPSREPISSPEDRNSFFLNTLNRIFNLEDVW